MPDMQSAARRPGGTVGGERGRARRAAVAPPLASPPPRPAAPRAGLCRGGMRTKNGHVHFNGRAVRKARQCCCQCGAHARRHTELPRRLAQWQQHGRAWHRTGGKAHVICCETVYHPHLTSCMGHRYMARWGQRSTLFLFILLSSESAAAESFWNSFVLLESLFTIFGGFH